MKISDILKQHDKGAAFEFFPPKTKKAQDAFISTLRALKEYKPLYASMTYGAAGTTQEKSKEAVYTLLQDKELAIMPHLTCIGTQLNTIENLLDEYKDNGIENIMALRGDMPEGLSGHSLLNKDFCYAKDLVRFIKKYNHFCVGVAVYPEGHIETASLDEDMEYIKQKIDTGADFAVTQMFFDNAYYYSFLDRMEKRGINIPVLPGILPLTDINKIRQFASICRTTIPQNIEEEMSRFMDQPQEMRKIGIDFTIKQCQDLVNNGVKRIHFFTLNKPKTMTKILNAIY